MNISKHAVIGIAVTVAVAAAHAAMAETVQPLAALQKRAQDFLSAHHQQGGDRPVEIEVNPLDPTLQLANCGAPLEAFLPNGSRTLGNTSVGVRCPGPQPWTVYLRASVRAFGDVLVAARFLTRGMVLTAADLKTERRDLTTVMEFETTPERLLGKQLRRPMQPGMVITPRAVIERPLIKQGDRVTVLARHAGMEISSSGIALRDAGLGERLSVRNESSQRMVEGTVIADHRVEIKL